MAITIYDLKPRFKDLLRPLVRMHDGAQLFCGHRPATPAPALAAADACAAALRYPRPGPG